MTSELKPVTQTWRSGHFLDKPRDAPPYNGLEIVGTYTPTTDGGFDAVKVTFRDYTLARDGVSTEIPALRASDNWTAVPQPEPYGDPKETKFTVFGDVRIETVASGQYLRVRLQYGDLHAYEEEIGFIFALSLAKSDS